jgi:acyl-CoA synthetase (AMP-forming)/AMP-acid ligase II
VTRPVATLADVVADIAARQPHDPALIHDGVVVTFAELDRRIRATGAALDGPVGPAARVAVIGANHPGWVELYYGVPGSGRLLVFLNHRLNAVELAEMLRRSDAEVVIGERAHLDRLREVGISLPMVDWDEWRTQIDLTVGPAERSAVDPDSPAWLLFTSGTTSAPKGALLSHANVLAAVAASAAARPVDVDDIYVFPFPLCHIAGYNVVHRHAHGRPVVLVGGFDAPSFCDVIESTGATSTSVAATMLASLLDEFDADPTRLAQLRSLRLIAYGAAPMPATLLRRAHEVLGVDFAQGYGMTELAGTAVFLDAAGHRRGLAGEHDLLRAAGRPAPGVEVRIVDDDDLEVEIGSVGEIVVRAPQVMLGYLDDPVTTAETLRGGWLHTGDMGRFESGELHVVDRKKDIIITGGENVSSLEVEEAVLAHPSVAAVAVVGVPDPTWGENVCAIVVPRRAAEFDAAELVTFVRRSLAGFKAPRHVLVVEELPVNASGKVRKAELRTMVAADPELLGPRR